MRKKISISTKLWNFSIGKDTRGQYVPCFMIQVSFMICAWQGSSNLCLIFTCMGEVNSARFLVFVFSSLFGVMRKISCKESNFCSLIVPDSVLCSNTE